MTLEADLGTKIASDDDARSPLACIDGSAIAKPIVRYRVTAGALPVTRSHASRTADFICSHVD